MLQRKPRRAVLNSNNATSNEKDYNMSIINENVDDNTSPLTTAQSSPSQNSILSLVDLPTFLDKILDIVQCPISYDTMKISAYAQDGHLYNRESIRKLIGEKYSSPMTRVPLALEDTRADPTGVKIVEAIRECELTREQCEDLKSHYRFLKKRITR